MSVLKVGAATGLSTVAWNPSKITGLVAWFRGDVASSSGTDLTMWPDLSGAGLHLDTPSASAPQVNSSNSFFNNQATVDFLTANSTSVERATGTFMANDYNVFVLCKTDASLATNVVMDTQTIQDGMLYVTQSTLLPAVSSGTPLSTSTNVLSSVFIFDVWWNNTGTEVAVNGTIDATGDAGGDPAVAGLVVGAAGDNSFNMNGSVAEIIITSGHIDDSSADYASLMGYLNTRYGLSLPATRQP